MPVSSSTRPSEKMYAKCQRLLSEEAGMVCFAIGDHLDAAVHQTARAWSLMHVTT
jgi:hypothetical protein